MMGLVKNSLIVCVRISKTNKYLRKRYVGIQFFYSLIVEMKGNTCGSYVPSHKISLIIRVELRTHGTEPE